MELSLSQTRRVALAAQGFGGKKPARPTIDHVLAVARQVAAINIDSINVLARSHYLVPFSRLGPYRLELLDELAYERRTLFEGGHSTALLPVELYPLLQYRTKAWRARGAYSPKGVKIDPAYIEAVYEEVEGRGPIAANELSEPGHKSGPWWGWSSGKTALEYLWRCGRVAVAGRENFTRLYDITERVIPADVLRVAPPDDEESQKQLLCTAARALGVAPGAALVALFGLRGGPSPPGADGKRPRPVWPRLLEELVEEGRLQAVAVETWTEPGYAVPDVRVPRAVNVRALLSPFDDLVTKVGEPVFGFVQHLAQQLYVPPSRREYGYYVLPFLLGDELAGRCDLKADRQGRALLVPSAYTEPNHDRRVVAEELAQELDRMRAWLGLDIVLVGDRGDLVDELRRSVARLAPALR